MYGCNTDYPILIPFILIPFSIPFHSHSILISIADQLFHFQALNVSPVTQTIARCGDQTPASVPPPTKGRSSPSNTPVFPPSSFILPSFVWFYGFFSSGHVLLSTLSWRSTCTSVSEGVVLMCPWGEMYSTSTYSSAILFSPEVPWFWS